MITVGPWPLKHLRVPRRWQQVHVDLVAKVLLALSRQLDKVTMIHEETDEIGIGKNATTLADLCLSRTNPGQTRDVLRCGPGSISQMLKYQLVETGLPPG